MPEYRAIQREQPELMTFLLQEYPKLANAPDPCFERALERLKEACSCFSLVQLRISCLSAGRGTQVLAGRRLPSAWLLFAAFTRGANPFWVLSGKGTPLLNWNYRAARGALDALEERPLLTRMLKRTAQWASR